MASGRKALTTPDSKGNPKRWVVLWILAASLSGCASTAQTVGQRDNPFVVVLIDKKTESGLGPFPYDRSVLAAAVRRSAELGVKGVVLKFFLDVPRSGSGDRELADAMKNTKVLLQAGDGESGSPQDLPDRFKLANPVGRDRKSSFASTGGLPLDEFLANAYDVGFVDNFRIGTDRVPIVERYGSRYVKWLVVSCLELALDQTAEVTPGVSIRFGKQSIALNAQSEALIRYPDKDDLQYVSFIDFLDQGFHPDVKNRVVIVGFDGDQMPTVPTPIGAIKVHRMFYYGLVSLYASLSRGD